MDDDFLLRLYRLARESGPSEFQPAAIRLLRSALDFQSAFWGEGHLLPAGTGAILKSAQVDQIDPGFLSEWQAMNYQDRIIPVVVANPGRSLEVRVASFYRAEPEWAALGEKYGMRSFSVSSQIAPDDLQCRWLSLYRAEVDTSGSRSDLDWLDFLMPHLGEAWRIHRVIHPTPGDGLDATLECLAVADRQSGKLLNAEPGFCEAMALEWKAFDGIRIPLPIRHLWSERGAFDLQRRRIHVYGSCTSELVMLTARVHAGQFPITRRQLEVATVYAQGWSHKEIAAKVRVSPATVRNHLANVYEALGVHSRRELAAALERWMR